ncbi:MAG: hypothetical protein ACLSDQ_01270 [Adlercreutzia equolifaciens]
MATLLRVAVNRDDSGHFTRRSPPICSRFPTMLFSRSPQRTPGRRKATAKAKVMMAVLAPVSLSLAASSDERKMMGFPSGRTIAPLYATRRCLRDFVRRAVREEPALALRRFRGQRTGGSPA